MEQFSYRGIALLWSLALMTGPTAAFEGECVPVDPGRQLEWTVDDVLSCEWASDWRISPDCRWAIWLKHSPGPGKSDFFSGGKLLLASLTEKKEIQVTHGNEECNEPQWCPDGKSIAFKSKGMLWIVNPFGGEPWKLTDNAPELLAFEWSGPGSIIFTAQEASAIRGQTADAKTDTSKVFEDESCQPPVRLFEIDLTTRKVVRLTENTDRIREFWISPDKSQVVTHHDRSIRNFYDRSVRPLVFLTDLKTKKRRQIFAEPGYNLNRLRWEPDSQGFYVVNEYSRDPNHPFPLFFEVYHYTLATDFAEKVDLHWENGLASAVAFETTDNGFLTLLANGVRPRAARYTHANDKWHREWIAGPRATNVCSFQIGLDAKTLIYQAATASEPERSYRAVLNGVKIEAPVELTGPNLRLSKKTFARTEVVHWKGALGDTVEGLLQFPLHYQPGNKYPLIVHIHGGPAAAVTDRWFSYPLWNFNLLSSRGVFVFSPNFHGSSDYGLNWAESVIGRLTKLEVQDVEQGVDYLIQQGLVAADNLALSGWSYGGGLVGALTVATNRYKAAISGDGPIDWVNYWARSEVGASFCGNYFGKTPLEDPSRLMRASSFYQMANVTTPTLIFFGANDSRVPVEQGWMYYRALQQTGKAEARFILFPEEGHGPSKMSSLRRTIEEELGWYDKYLFRAAAAE